MSERSQPPASAPNFGAWLNQGYANLAVPRRADPSTLHQVGGKTMGTTWSVRFGNPAMLPLAQVRDCVEAALGRIVGQMSHWEADSLITRYNQAPADSWHTLPAEFFSVLQCALHWARVSGGACDPTLGALVNAWGFGPRADGANAGERGTPLSLAELQWARERTGWQRLRLDVPVRRIQQPGGMLLDLSGIAKGYAVDYVADALHTAGIDDCLVEVGGELLGRGRRPDGLPWRVAVAQPDAPAQSAHHVSLHNLAIATSGDTWHAFEHAGRRYSHTLDPRTGEPVQHALASVTVVHASCMQADILATVLTVLGPAPGLAFAQTQGLAALFIERKADGSQALTATPAFADLSAKSKS